MPIVSCPVDGCQFKTENVGEAIVLKLLDMHMFNHTVNQPTKSKGPKLNRQTIDVGASEEAWISFTRRWETFRKGSGISDKEASAQLFECASYELSEQALGLDQDIASRPISTLMSTL